MKPKKKFVFKIPKDGTISTDWWNKDVEKLIKDIRKDGEEVGNKCTHIKGRKHLCG